MELAPYLYKENNYSLAMNWYATKHIKVTTDYIRAEMSNRKDHSDRKLNTIALRLQTVF